MQFDTNAIDINDVKYIAHKFMIVCEVTSFSTGTLADVRYSIYDSALPIDVSSLNYNLV